MTVPRAPRGLKARGARLWRELHGLFNFDNDPHRSVLIEDACRTADLIDRLQRIVDNADNVRVRGSQGQPTAMPELDQLRANRALLASLLKALGLPDSEEMQDIKDKYISDVRRAAAKSKPATLKVVDNRG